MLDLPFVRAVLGLLVAATFLSPHATFAQSAAPEMSANTGRRESVQIVAGIASQNGMPGRTLGLDTICGTCQVEKFTSECEGRLEGPNFDKDGNLWLVGQGNGNIYRVTPDGHCQTMAKTPWPNGTRFARDGSLLGVDKKLGVFSLDTKTLKITWLATQAGAGNFHGLDDLYIDRTGGAYLTDAYGSSVLNPQGQIFYLTPEGKVRKLIAGNLAFPNGIVLSPDERTLYIDDYDTNRIIAVSVTAPGEISIDSAYVFAYLNGGHGPDSMTIDSLGNIYAAHYGAGEVAVFDPHGFYYGAIRLPPGAGMITSNMAFHNGYLYITEMDQHTIWRVRTRIPGADVWPNG